MIMKRAAVNQLKRFRLKIVLYFWSVKKKKFIIGLIFCIRLNIYKIEVL